MSFKNILHLTLLSNICFIGVQNINSIVWASERKEKLNFESKTATVTSFTIVMYHNLKLDMMDDKKKKKKKNLRQSQSSVSAPWTDAFGYDRTDGTTLHTST